MRLWDCCECCDGIAKDDHVGFGGSIEKDMHEELCRSASCDQTESEHSRLSADGLDS